MRRDSSDNLHEQDTSMFEGKGDRSHHGRDRLAGQPEEESGNVHRARWSTPNELHSNRRSGLIALKNRPTDPIPGTSAQTHLQTVSESSPPSRGGTFGRWSGSIQNLFSIGQHRRVPTIANSAGGEHGWSKSENCLTEVGQQRRSGGNGRERSSRPWFGRAGRDPNSRHGRARRSNNFLTSGGGSFFTYRYDDEEESAWQKYFSFGMLRKIRPQKAAQTAPPKDRRIQDLDGSFFEKFGSILRQKSIQNDEHIRSQLAPLPDEEETSEKGDDEASRLPPVAEADDSGNETLADSDPEDQQDKQVGFIGDAFGWNEHHHNTITMSTYSLPRLIGGGGLSGNKKFNLKFGGLRLSKSFRSLDRREKVVPSRSASVVHRDSTSLAPGTRRPSESRELPNGTVQAGPSGNVHRLGRIPYHPYHPFRGVRKEELEHQASQIVHSMTIEELYEEVLFETIHNIGCEDEEVSADVLFPYIQEAFKMTDEKHQEIMEVARNKEAPEIRLNVEIIEAKDLEPKDSNGLSDPFVTMYIASNPNHRYNTSVKSATLDPVWEEHFSLPITEDANEANLIVEVWDFDPAETVREKMNKLFEVKGVRGLRKLMKEIAQTASSGKHDNELIGRTSIPLKSIPASGMLMWYNLDKKNKLRRQGTLRVRLNFSSEKNSHVAAQEHRHLLRVLLLHELESSKVAPYWWSGKFTIQGEAILTQHSAQSGLSSTTETFIQWSVFTAIHQDHPLSFVLFDGLLEKLVRPIQTHSVSAEELKSFWEATKKLLPSCFSVIRKLRKRNTGDKLTLKTLTDVLNIIAKVALLEPPEGTDLFPVHQYGWIRRSAGENDEPNWDIREALASAVVSGAEDFFGGIKEGHFLQTGTDEDRLQNMIKIIQLVRSDVQKGKEYYDKTFKDIMHFPYAKELYITYELKLAELIKPTVEDICRKVKRIQLPEGGPYQRGSDGGAIEFEDINMGTTLFELYIVLKRFCAMGTELSPNENNFAIDEYHRWFMAGVTHWLDIAVYKALTRIHKAIELDKLQPEDATVKYSSSAVDTLAIFYQIKIFWQQLAWPDVEGAYIFVAKIVDDICRCCVFYADRMSARVENLGVVENAYEKRFEVTKEWCLAINNIDYMRQSLKPFTTDLGVDDILAKLADVQSGVEAERCKDTLRAVLDNAIDTEKNKILDLVEKLARKMAPAMRRFLLEGAELLQQDSNSLDRLMMYMEDSLKLLNSELNDDNFERVLNAIWVELTTILYDLIQGSLDKRRPPSFYANLRDTLHVMVANFKTDANRASEGSGDKDTLAHIERLLQLHGYETTDLIHQYYLDRLEEQKQTEPGTGAYGMLTVQCFFKGNVLELEIVNARNLKPMDGNGSCDPFVRVHFLPEERFVGVVKPKTQCLSKTLFPLFDEKFVITFTPEQRAIQNAMIMFSIKDKDLFGMSNQYLAECYLGFSDIADISGDTGKIEQKHLILTRPNRMDVDCLRALEYRQGDKQAKDFMKKLKQKMNGQ
ncbi:protein unc-13 homolog 4B-like isoform X3 [Anopheles darlingi]|uniref:protein unc-13 homolog 4B-like isoform X3 n=1 Tax=Anopheles darlingi TaxID=43151 RepID=UPI0021003FFF|nr:protein unc-13 homolog 4B-like isoform X3 [Anopheles darlingi]